MTYTKDGDYLVKTREVEEKLNIEDLRTDVANLKKALAEKEALVALADK